MKKIILLGLFLFSASLFGQMVPESWEKDLAGRHPKATAVTWISGDGIYTAEFQSGDRKMKAIYTQEGEWMRSIMEIPLSEVPEEIKQNIAPGHKITGASKVVSSQKREGEYILQLEGTYNKKGELISQKKK